MWGEVARLGATKAIVLGSTAAVGPSVEASLVAMLGEGNVERIGGANRYETAAMAASAAVAAQGAAYDGTAFVTTGRNFPDALAASPMAWANTWPIYLVGPTLDPATKAAMLAAGVRTVHILGDEKAVTPAVQQALEGAFPTVDRIKGTDRYDTAARVAEFAVAEGGLYWSHPAVATGESFPDALTGGVLQGSDYSVMLLTRKLALPGATRSVFEAHKQEVYDVRFLGSTSTVAPDPRAAIMGVLF